MEECLQFVSVDVWTMIFTWANLLILFLLLKKFLFKPVNKVLDARANEIESTYRQAEKTKNSAEELKEQYERKLLQAKSEADSIIKSAVETANLRSDSIINGTTDKVKHIMEKSQNQIEQDKKNAINEARTEIASMAVDVAEKLIGEKFNEEKDKKLISDIIDRI